MRTSPPLLNLIKLIINNKLTCPFTPYHFLPIIIFYFNPFIYYKFKRLIVIFNILKNITYKLVYFHY